VAQPPLKMSTALPVVRGLPILTYWLPIPIPLPSHLHPIEQIHSLVSFDGCAGCILTIPLFVDWFLVVLQGWWSFGKNWRDLCRIKKRGSVICRRAEQKNTIAEDSIVRVWYTADSISGSPTDRIRNVILRCWLPDVAFGASACLPNQKARLWQLVIVIGSHGCRCLSPGCPWIAE